MTTTQPAVGTRMDDLVVPAISRTTLALFAGGSGDLNPIHVDLDVAHSAGLQDVFAHGMLSMAYLGRLLTDNFGVDAIRSHRVRFAAVTPVHGQPTCRASVRAVDEVAGERRAELDIEVVLPDGSVTLTGSAVVALT